MGYGNYGGYGGYGASPYGPIAGSSFLPPYPYPGMMPGGPGQDEFSSKHGKEKKAKGLEGFCKGLYNGAVNTIKGIFSVQGLAMTAATAGLVWATGGAALIPLAALGAGIGGFQLVKGIAKGDAEGVGEGVFTTAASLLGLKFTPKNVNLAGKSYTLTGEGEKLGLVGRMKAAWGGSKYKSADGEMNVWQMGLAKLKSRFQPKSAAEVEGAGNRFDPTTWKSRKDIDRLPTLNMKQKEFRQKYAEALKKRSEPATSPESGKQKLGADLEQIQAQNKADADLAFLGEQARFPKQKTVEWYQKGDNRLRDEINALRGEKRLKKLYTSDAEIKFIDQQIKDKEALRTQLLDKFKAKTERSAKSREAYMLDAHFKPEQAANPKQWKYQPKKQTDVPEGMPLTEENLTAHNNSPANSSGGSSVSEWVDDASSTASDDTFASARETQPGRLRQLWSRMTGQEQ